MKDLNQEPLDNLEQENIQETKEEFGDIHMDIAKTLEEFAKTQNQLKETEKELESTKDTFQRTLAEYDNFRKRSAKEKAENFINGKISAVTSLIPVMDTLEIALQAPCSDEEYKKGIEMIITAAKNSLAELGVEEIEALGKEFDPNVHSAVVQQAAEGAESGTVTALLKKGYKIGDKVIRHAAVAVAP